MRIELYPFQRKALRELRSRAQGALHSYFSMKIPQVVSFTAPTGSGKTIIITALFESILYGDDVHPEQSNAVLVWLSDSPELNEQSKQKIDTKSDKINLNQTEIINDETFDQEMLDDGMIYFLNTQKLGKSSNLTKDGDTRQYTIWETLTNTIQHKSDRLYFIIDEAHRGMRESEEDKATTIMQKFIKGSPEDDLPAVPVVIGMSATVERFNKLVSDTTSTIHKVAVTPGEVRSSGLLKDRIIVTHPEDDSRNNDMAVLAAATIEWQDKWDHWHQYCYEQHYQQVYPIFVIQVKNAKGKTVSDTDLDDCLAKIEETIGLRFDAGEVVHTFGDTGKITINGLEVEHIDPSEIADNRKVKIVFFKENLSTGWDCPRAETMISFRGAQDTTYITQLLGRMVRTPLQMRVNVDESLNDVHLFLPYFNKENVEDVIQRFQTTEGNQAIASDVYSDSIETPGFETWTVHVPPVHRESPNTKNRVRLEPPTNTNDPYTSSWSKETATTGSFFEDEALKDDTIFPKEVETINDEGTSEDTNINSPVDRQGIIRYINESGLLTYRVRRVRINSYLKTMFSLARFLTQNGLAPDALDEVFNEIVKKIRAYVERLQEIGQYEALLKEISQFSMLTKSFDVYGQSVVDELQTELFASTTTDIDKKFKRAEHRLGSEGVGNRYGNTYYDNENPDNFKLDVILFSMEENNIVELDSYAQNKFYDLHDRHRRQTVNIEDKLQEEYKGIVANGDEVTPHNFKLPEIITVAQDFNGDLYLDHLFANSESGLAKIKLNSWEKAVLEEEQDRDDFVSWLRNEDRKSWALCIPYQIDRETRSAYPDLLIIRRDDKKAYVADLLEPHRPDLDDNLPKAKGFAEYARLNPGLGRIELIRIPNNDISGLRRFKRLDMAKSEIQNKVLRATNNEELNHIFDTDGYFYK